MGNVLSLMVCVAIPVAGGFAGAWATKDEVKNWYKRIKKPFWTPPNWIFGPMWTALYVAMGVSSWMVYSDGGFEMHGSLLGIYALHLAANFSWSPLFFGRHALGLALANILFLDAGIITCISLFRPVSVLASNLLIPYLVWCTYATALNADILARNWSDFEATEGQDDTAHTRLLETDAGKGGDLAKASLK